MLSAALDSRENKYNAVRLLAAIAVIVSHTYFILTPGEAVQPLSWAAFDLGASAVNVFFVLSGVMVSRSFARNTDVWRFIKARLLRIYPALVVAGIATVLLIGPMAAELPLPKFLTNSEALSYPLRVIYEFADARVSEAFTHNIRDETNLALWTIRYELLAYVAFVGLAILGLVQGRMFLVSALCVAAPMVFMFELAPQPGSFAFLVGMVACSWADRLPLSLPAACIGVLAALNVSGVPGEQVVSILAFGYAGLTLGAIPIRALALVRRHDISYGLYLYGFPVQQAFAHHIVWPGLGLFAHLGITLAATSCLAIASWLLVEKPALTLK